MSNIDDENDSGKSNKTNKNTPPHWTGLLQKNSKSVINNLYNCHVIISHDEEFKNIFFYNEMSGRPCLRKVNGSDTYHLVDDIFHEHVRKYIQHHYIANMSMDNIKGAILLECYERKFHPVKEDIEKEKWDGKQRVETWLHTYMGAEDSSYHAVIGQCFLISMIARIYKPACQCDYMLVFEGPQGIGKSSAFKILAGEYYSDSLNELSTKDAKIHTVSFWLHELAEMHAILSTRSDALQVKHFLTRKEEIFRPPYGIMEVIRPRQCVFAGTTNQDRYLRDETGNRRFWPVKCGAIDLEALKRDRGQLLAEAKVMFDSKVPWWPDRQFEDAFIKPQQTTRLEFDEWQNVIVHQLNLNKAVAPGSRVPKFESATIAEIYRHWISSGESSRLSTVEAMRIGKILRALGAVPTRTTKGMVWNLNPCVS